jgi:hypothetical protein
MSNTLFDVARRVFIPPHHVDYSFQHGKEGILLFVTLNICSMLQSSAALKICKNM